MREVTLSTGKTVKIDTSKAGFMEWRRFFSGKGTEQQDDAFIEKLSGLHIDETVTRDDIRRIVIEILKAGNEPLSDPNSVSEST